MNYRLLPLLSLVVFLSGCQTWTHGGKGAAVGPGYSANIPADWIYHPSLGGELIATRDGVFLQRLAITRTPISMPLPATKRLLSPALSTAELAEALIDEWKNDRSLEELQIVENLPAKLDGKPAVLITLDYKTKDGLHVSNVRQLCIHNGYLYRIQLSGPSRHYFPNTRPAFDSIAASFKFTD